jgi:subtilisin family serine protease
MPDDFKRLDKLMRAQYRFAAGSICLLLLQSIGSFCANTGFAQLAPAVVAAAQDLPSRAPALAVPNEVLIVFRHDAPQNVEDIARDYRLVHVESYSDRLLERTVHHFRISSGDVPVAGLPSRNRMRSTSPRSEQSRKKDDESSQEKADAARIDEYISSLSSDPRIESVQPNYVYERKDDHSRQEHSRIGSQDQYVLTKLRIKEAHRLATGARIKIAVIDSEIDATHPELQGAVETELKVVGDSAGPDKHGTAIAGAIVSHGDLLGVAPAARILAVRAFSDAGGTTLTITRSIDWSFQSGARIINMSFAGPKDPLLHREVTAAYNRGVILVAAAGNAGTDSPPMYPAAYPEVIAVTATDFDDRVLQQANTGRYVAIAAPGVEIVAPHPGGTYQFSTGTSIAAAHVSGVAALLLERNPRLRPDEIRSILVATADKVKTGEFVPGRVNALKALIVITKMPAGSSSTHQISGIRR